MQRPEWKTKMIEAVAEACSGPGGSTLLRGTMAPALEPVLNLKPSTICKYVEDILGKHYTEEW